MNEGFRVSKDSLKGCDEVKKPFVISFDAENIGFEENAEANTLTQIVRSIGYEPEEVLVRGVSGKEARERVFTVGHDVDEGFFAGHIYAYEIEEISKGEYGFGRVTYIEESPFFYALGFFPSINEDPMILVYNKEKFDYDDILYKATFESDPLDALIGVIDLS